MTDEIKHVVYDELPSEKGFKLSHIGNIVLRKLSSGSEKDVETDLTVLGFLHTEASAIISEMRKIKLVRDAETTVKDLLKNISS